MKPEFAAAAAELKERDPPIILGKVDVTQNEKLGQEFEIRGFPTLFWFNHGEKKTYGGGRTKDDIIKWVNKKSGPPSIQVTCDELKEKVEQNKFVVAYFGPEDTDLYRDAHAKLGDDEMEIPYLHTDDESCAAHYEAPIPSVVFFRNFESPVHVYQGAPSDAELSAFMAPLKIP